MNINYLRPLYLVLALGGAGCGPLPAGEAEPDEALSLEENESAISGCYSTINAKYLALGGAQGFLGLPLIPESVTAGGTGVHRSYQGGAIYKRNGGCAYAVQGGIAARWGELGFERGTLGYPTSDEEWVIDGYGRVSHFELGSMYWTPAYGTAVIRGNIRTKWLALGGVNSPLGYPVRDVVNGIAPPAIQDFEWGTIFDPITAPSRAVFGAIGELHRQLGGASGIVGVPTTDEYNCWPRSLGVRCQRFAHGMISWTPSGGALYRP